MHHPPPHALSNVQSLRRYRQTEHNIHRQPTLEEELQDFGREMGGLDGELRFAAAHPAFGCPPSGTLTIDIHAMERRRDSWLTGIGGDVSGYGRGRIQQQIEDAEAWNELVRHDFIVRGDDDAPRSGIALLPEVAQALEHDDFAHWFNRTSDARLEALETQRLEDQIFEVVMLVLELLMLRMGAGRRIASVPGSTRSFSTWLRAILGRLRTALLRPRTLRQVAQQLVRALRRAGRRVIVNIGGESSSREIASYGEEARHAINLNPLTSARPQQVPNLVRAQAERIAELFDGGQVDEIISHRLPPNTLDWQRIIPGAHRVLKPGGRITIAFQGVGGDAAVIVREMEAAGFRNIDNIGNIGAAIRAIK